MRTWRAYDGIPHNPRRYAEPLSGVLLSYSGLRLKRPLGRISHDAPEVHVCVEFDATYFAPRVGDVLEGTVSRIGEDHIALLVLGVFNASVARKPLSPAVARTRPRSQFAACASSSDVAASLGGRPEGYTPRVAATR